MPTRKELLEQIGAQRDAAERQARRGVAWALVRCGAECVGWMLAGLCLLG